MNRKYSRENWPAHRFGASPKNFRPNEVRHSSARIVTSSLRRSYPEVFIIESLASSDETAVPYEGQLIRDVLRMSGKHCEYRYIRTRRELMWAVQLFRDSQYRYLHLSGHGSPSGYATTLDKINLDELGQLLRPALRDRRLFISACSMTNTELANSVIPGSGCYSIVGPRKDIAFGHAFLLWASFYHLMFKRNEKAMKRADIISTVHCIATTFDVPLRYYSASRSEKRGYRIRAVNP